MTWLKGKAGPELKKRAREQRRPLLKTVVSSAQVVMMLASEQYEYQNPFTSKGLVADEGAAGIARRPKTTEICIKLTFRSPSPTPLLPAPTLSAGERG